LLEFPKDNLRFSPCWNAREHNIIIYYPLSVLFRCCYCCPCFFFTLS
jgi:hypothetical protein